MTEAQLRDLIREVIAGLMPQRATPPPSPTTGLVLFTGALLGFEQACASLARLNPQMTLDWIQTDSARRAQTAPKAEQMISSASMTGSRRSIRDQ